MTNAHDASTMKPGTLAKLPAEPGTYALVLLVEHLGSVTIGRLGPVLVKPGFYVYAGSALGPSGLAARISRHARQEKKRHWHIDYLQPTAKLEEVWCLVAPDRQECRWAASLARMRRATMPLANFGASDCRCRSHLLHFPARPTILAFGRQLAKSVGPFPPSTKGSERNVSTPSHPVAIPTRFCLSSR